ncbi:putative membrane protein [Moumouvirus maliensis]|nr:putative membrane protein [Moumouvirus maliensis]
MIKAISLGLLTAIVGCGIYKDFLSRKFFNDYIKSGRSINGKIIITGQIKDENNSDEKYPFYLYEVMTRGTMYLYNYYNYNYNPLTGKYNYSTRMQKNKYHYWDLSSSQKYNSYTSKIDQYKLILNDNTKIHYQKEETQYLDKKNYILKKYIPNNSNITIFGKLTNDLSMYSNTYCHVEFIGSKNQVIYDIGEKYFGIRDEYTIFLYFSLGLCLYNIFYY